MNDGKKKETATWKMMNGNNQRKENYIKQKTVDAEKRNTKLWSRNV